MKTNNTSDTKQKAKSEDGPSIGDEQNKKLSPKLRKLAYALVATAAIPTTMTEFGCKSNEDTKATPASSSLPPETTPVPTEEDIKKEEAKLQEVLDDVNKPIKEELPMMSVAEMQKMENEEAAREGREPLDVSSLIHSDTPPEEEAPSDEDPFATPEKK